RRPPTPHRPHLLLTPAWGAAARATPRQAGRAGTTLSGRMPRTGFRRNVRRKSGWTEMKRSAGERDRSQQRE
ncbi:MAG: hypothetical protein QMD99_01335, partial [Rhizobiaceae bacterium]|nr:hypothetical protein [Rhizobiaceae bacterium]